MDCREALDRTAGLQKICQRPARTARTRAAQGRSLHRTTKRTDAAARYRCRRARRRISNARQGLGGDRQLPRVRLRTDRGWRGQLVGGAQLLHRQGPQSQQPMARLELVREARRFMGTHIRRLPIAFGHRHQSRRRCVCHRPTRQLVSHLPADACEARRVSWARRFTAIHQPTGSNLQGESAPPEKPDRGRSRQAHSGISTAGRLVSVP